MIPAICKTEQALELVFRRGMRCRDFCNCIRRLHDGLWWDIKELLQGAGLDHIRIDLEKIRSEKIDR